MLQIIDLDGCISDDRWRRHLIREGGAQERFMDYHALCASDAFVNAHEIDRTADLIVLTGRPVWCRQRTLYWLKFSAKIVPVTLIMRNDHDHMPNLALKRRMVGTLFDPQTYGYNKDNVVSAIDDRADIVAMYRDAYGLAARVVRVGNEEHANG